MPMDGKTPSSPSPNQLRTHEPRPFAPLGQHRAEAGNRERNRTLPQAGGAAGEAQPNKAPRSGGNEGFAQPDRLGPKPWGLGALICQWELRRSNHAKPKPTRSNPAMTSVLTGGTYPHDVLRSTSPHLAVPGDRPKVAVGLGGEMQARPICAETGSMWPSMRSAPRAFSCWGGRIDPAGLTQLPKSG